MTTVVLNYVPNNNSKLLEGKSDDYVPTFDLQLPSDKMLWDIPAENVNSVTVDEVNNRTSMEVPANYHNLVDLIEVGTFEDGIQTLKQLDCKLPDWFEKV